MSKKVSKKSRISPRKTGIRVDYTTGLQRGKATKPTVSIGASQSELKWVPVAKLAIDVAYQRNERPSLVKYIAETFDVDAFGVILVSVREGGQMVVLDGQQRLAAMRLMNWTDQNVPARVWTGLSQAQEAWIFAEANGKRVAVQPIDLFKARVTSAEPKAVEIQSVLDELGIKVGYGQVVGYLQAISSAERVYDAGGAKLLHRALTVLMNAWPHDNNALLGSLVTGCAAVYTTNPAAKIDDKRLAKRLSTLTPDAVVGKAKQLKSLRGHSLTVNVMEVIVGLYNSRLGVGEKLVVA